MKKTMRSNDTVGGPRTQALPTGRKAEATQLPDDERLSRKSERVLSLSQRLIILYSLLVAGTLLVVGGVVVTLTRDYLGNQIEDSLRALVDSYERRLTNIDSIDELEESSRSWLDSQSLTEDEFAVVMMPKGTAARAGGLDPSELSGYGDLLASTETRSTRLDGDRVLAIGRPLRFDNEQVGNLVVGSSVASAERTVTALLRGTLLASFAGLILAVLVGWAAIRRQLRPLTTRSAEIEEMRSTGNLRARLNYDGPLDEVGRLGIAFDELLGQLGEAIESQRRFLSDASHELRTPLTVVRGQLELLSEESKDPASQRSISLAMEEVERTRRIVRDLLLLARLDEGTELAREPVEVELVVREAFLRGQLINQRPSTVDVEPGLWALGDPDRLFQVLANIVINAVQHTDSESQLHIGARRVGKRVVIEVEDTGEGIPEDELPRVFERFHRGATARTGTPGGSGLGLAIAASLVRSMGGEISVRSTRGQGTTFIVSLDGAQHPDDSANREPVGQSDF
jgi:signal transduction histidine kinase